MRDHSYFYFTTRTTRNASSVYVLRLRAVVTFETPTLQKPSALFVLSSGRAVVPEQDPLDAALDGLPIEDGQQDRRADVPERRERSEKRAEKSGQASGSASIS